MSNMSNRYLKIDSINRYVTSITIGQAPRPGFEYVAQGAEIAHVGVGWSYVDGQFSDTRAAYRDHLANIANIRDFRSQSFLASLPET